MRGRISLIRFLSPSASSAAESSLVPSDRQTDRCVDSRLYCAPTRVWVHWCASGWPRGGQPAVARHRAGALGERHKPRRCRSELPPERRVPSPTPVGFASSVEGGICAPSVLHAFPAVALILALHPSMSSTPRAALALSRGCPRSALLLHRSLVQGAVVGMSSCTRATLGTSWKLRALVIR